ncbi:MAG: hypothetical protein MPJ50_12240 [Pirellulales bacterium]|nr:hypothetical protein [Pirellulales bacterium]
MTRVMIFAATLFYAPVVAAAADGELGEYTFTFTGKPVRVYTYTPAEVTKDSPVVFVMHGTTRVAKTYRQPWIELGDKYKCHVLVPKFAREEFSSQQYHFGNVKTRQKLNPEDEWTYSSIDKIFEKYTQDHGLSAKKYNIYGHSAGGQFVHRMVLTRPDAKYNIAVAANAGSYTFPDFEIDWGYGLKGTPTDIEKLKVILQRKLVIALGDKDNDPNHRQLPRGRQANAQGAHRLARGKNFYEKGKEMAEKLGVEFNWKVKVVPGIAHSGSGMAPPAAEAMFVDK